MKTAPAIFVALLGLVSCDRINPLGACASDTVQPTLMSIVWDGDIPNYMFDRITLSNIVVEDADPTTGKISCRAEIEADLDGDRQYSGSQFYDIQPTTDGERVMTLHFGPRGNNLGVAMVEVYQAYQRETERSQTQAEAIEGAAGQSVGTAPVEDPLPAAPQMITPPQTSMEIEP